MRNPRLRDKHLLAGHYATELTRDLNGVKCGSGLQVCNALAKKYCRKETQYVYQWSGCYSL